MYHEDEDGEYGESTQPSQMQKKAEVAAKAISSGKASAKGKGKGNRGRGEHVHGHGRRKTRSKKELGKEQSFTRLPCEVCTCLPF